MLRESDVPRFWELVCTYPTDTDYMAGLVLHALEKGGKIPIDEVSLSKGLKKAALEAYFLQRFVDGDGKITPAAKKAIGDLEEEEILERTREGWVVPDRQVTPRVVHPAHARLNARVRSVFTPAGTEMLETAGKAAREAWVG